MMIVVRSCEGFDELEACVQLQTEVWGYDPTDVIPRKAFLVMQKVGGQVLGAFDTDLPGASSKGDPGSMVAFAMSLPGVKASPFGDAPSAYLHSHMLAVREDYRNRGLGTRLKLEQRRDALARGIRHMEWTFDPLEIKNAFLNIHKLGAIVRSYREDFYGVSSSRLQGGLPTDRLVAEWRLDSDRVHALLEGRPAAKSDVVEQLPGIVEQIEVPASIYQWKASNRERALTVQLENRRRFQQAFAQGLAVLVFDRDANGNGIYQLGPLAASASGF
jgi:predicted GNAT superfamily acetyltransferase